MKRISTAHGEIMAVGWQEYVVGDSMGRISQRNGGIPVFLLGEDKDPKNLGAEDLAAIELILSQVECPAYSIETGD